MKVASIALHVSFQAVGYISPYTEGKCFLCNVPIDVIEILQQVEFICLTVNLILRKNTSVDVNTFSSGIFNCIFYYLFGSFGILPNEPM